MYYQRIREARTRKNMTQKQLADAAQIAVGSVSAYEKGQKVPPVDAAYRMAAALGVSLDWLFNENMTEEESKGTAGSLGDVARAFLVLVDAGLLNSSKYEHISWRDSLIGFTEGTRAFYAHAEEDLGAGINNVLRITADLPEESRMIPFIEGVYKLIELVLMGTIDREIYQTWLSKKLEELDKVPLPLHKH